MNYIQLCIEMLMFFVEATLCFVFCNAFSQKRNNTSGKLRIVVPVFVCSVLLTLLNYSFEMFSPINTVLIIIIMAMQQFVIFRDNFRELTLLVIVYRGIVISLTFTVISIGHQMVGFNSSALNNENNTFFLQRDFPLFLSELAIVIIVVVLKNLTIDGDYLSNISRALSVILSFSLFLICVIFPEFESGEVYCFNYQYAGNSFIVIAEIAIVILFWALIFYNIFKPIFLNLYKRKLELADIKNTMLRNTLDETEQSFLLWRQSIHDYKNNIIALTQLANDGKLDKIQEYLSKEHNLLDSRMFYIKTGNSTVDAIINTKYNKARKKGINLTVNALLDENLVISDIDLVTILGNLLDNAIESSENESEPYIIVNMGIQKSFLIIKITNKFSGVFTENTKKTDKAFHGIGIKSVNRLTRKYEGEFTLKKYSEEVSAKVLVPLN